ncbi:transporter [Burkholderiaceae bacterium DAT-1]|nr:transporter [Burkholderiaceae bacterium DAT-1]
MAVKALRAGGALLVAALVGVNASENYDLRYAPGVGGADMSAPMEPGWVVQTPLYSYSGSIDHTSFKSTNLALLGAPIAGTATTAMDSKIRINVDGVLPRLTYLSNTQFLGANVGFTALLPLLRKKTDVSLNAVNTKVDVAALQAYAPKVNAAATVSGQAVAAANSNASSGVGDLELAPVLRWSNETSQWMFVPAVVLPTGKYDGDKAANPGSGNFYTFRPLVQYSYIGDGWDVGVRASVAFNSRNRDTHFRNGNYMNLDAALMRSVNDATRVGLAAYAVYQFTEDTVNAPSANAAMAARQDLTLGKKGYDYGIGPEIAWIKGAGDFMLDARYVREFASDNRPQGGAFWVNLSVPF